METTRTLGVVILLVVVVLVQSQPTTDHDCNGRSELCMGPFKYMKCRDDGTGRMTTEGIVLYCPSNTRCQNEGEVSCIPLKRAEPITEEEDTVAEKLVSESVLINQLGEGSSTPSTEKSERATDVTPPSEENSVNEPQVEPQIVEETASSKVTREQPEGGEKASIIDAANVQNESTITLTELPSNETNIISSSEATIEVRNEATYTTVSEEMTNITEADNGNSSIGFNEPTTSFTSIESSSIVATQKTTTAQEESSNIDATTSNSQSQGASTNEQIPSSEGALTNNTQSEKTDRVKDNTDHGQTTASTSTMEPSSLIMEQSTEPSTTIKEIFIADSSNIAANNAQSNYSSTIAPVETSTLILQAGLNEKEIFQGISAPIVDNSTSTSESDSGKNSVLGITATSSSSSSNQQPVSESPEPSLASTLDFGGEQEFSLNSIPSAASNGGSAQGSEISRVPSSSQGIDSGRNAANSVNEKHTVAQKAQSTGFTESIGVPKGSAKPIGNIEGVEIEDGISNNTIPIGNITETSGPSNTVKTIDTQTANEDSQASEVNATSIVKSTSSSAADVFNNTVVLNSEMSQTKVIGSQDSGPLPIPEITKNGATGTEENNEVVVVRTSKATGHNISETLDSIHQTNASFSGASGSVVGLSEANSTVSQGLTVGTPEDAATLGVEGINGTQYAETVGSPENAFTAPAIDAVIASPENVNGNGQTSQSSEIIGKPEIVSSPVFFEGQETDGYAESAAVVSTSIAEAAESGTQRPIGISGANITSNVPKTEVSYSTAGSNGNMGISEAAQGVLVHPAALGSDVEIFGESTQIGENSDAKGLSVNTGSASNLVPVEASQDSGALEAGINQSNGSHNDSGISGANITSNVPKTQVASSTAGYKGNMGISEAAQGLHLAGSGSDVQIVGESTQIVENLDAKGLSINTAFALNLIPAEAPQDSGAVEAGIKQFSGSHNPLGNGATDTPVQYPEQELSEFDQQGSQDFVLESVYSSVSQPGTAENVGSQTGVALDVIENAGSHTGLTGKKHQLANSPNKPQNVVGAEHPTVGTGPNSLNEQMSAVGSESGQGGGGSGFGSETQTPDWKGSAINPEVNSQGQVPPAGGQGWSGSAVHPELGSEAQSPGQVSQEEGQRWSASVISPEVQAPGQIPAELNESLGGNIINSAPGTGGPAFGQMPAAGDQDWDGSVINPTLGTEGHVPVESTQSSVAGATNPGQTQTSGGQGFEEYASGQISIAVGQSFYGSDINPELDSQGQGTGQPIAVGDRVWSGSVVKPGVGSEGRTPGQISLVRDQSSEGKTPSVGGQGLSVSVINTGLVSEEHAPGQSPLAADQSWSGGVINPGLYPEQTRTAGGQGWSGSVIDPGLASEGLASEQIPLSRGQSWDGSVINPELGSEGQGTGQPSVVGDIIGSEGHSTEPMPVVGDQGWSGNVNNPGLGSEGKILGLEGQGKGKVPTPSLISETGSISVSGLSISKETTEEFVESVQYDINKNSIPGSSKNPSNVQSSAAKSTSITISTESDESPESSESNYGGNKSDKNAESPENQNILQSLESLESKESDSKSKSTQSIESAESNVFAEADESKANNSAEVYSKENKESEENNMSDESNETDNHSKSGSSGSKKNEASKNKNKSSSSESVEDHNSTSKKHKKKFECEIAGHFADPHNCRKYYICSLKDNRKLKKYHLKCHDHQIYDMESEGCIHKCE